MKLTKIIIADDDEFWIQGLLALSEDEGNIQVVGHTVYLRELEALVEFHKPDVVVLDIAWPGDKLAGIKMITKLKETYQNIQIVAITAYPELVKLAQAKGAFTLKKGFRLTALIDTIWQATQTSGDSLMLPSLNKDIDNLTGRELEVLHMIAKGSKDREIAKQMYISGGTVKKHVGSILSKLGASNRAHAAVIAHRKNLL